MKLPKILTAVGCGFIAMLVVSCGGGSGTVATPAATPPPPAPPPTGGISGNGRAIGPVSNFGSIIVNGVRYETNSATFTINDVVGSQSDLSVGDIVTVSGTIDSDGTTGTANEVIFEDAVTGPVDSIDTVTGQIIVLGQTVLVSPETSFDDSFSPASLGGISVGQIVEVTGQFDADGNIVATRIEPKPADSPFEVHGVVSLLNVGAMTFNLNNLVVDFSAADLADFPGSQISEGDFVEAKGLSIGASGELIATRVELENPLAGAGDGDHLEVEGFITRFVSAQDFDVAGIPVTTNGSTTFIGGTAADLGPNVKVEAEGSLDSAGVLVATKIDIRQAKAVRATANVDSVDVSGNSMVILGITVSVDVLTRMEDKSSADVEPFTLSALNAGDYVEVRGGEFPAGSGNILAAILEREDADTEAILQGFAESVADPSFTILGVSISTNGGTVFRDENDIVISSAEFFSRLAINSLVKAKGAESSDTTITATEVEFETEF